jgi:hypothetical protein
VLPWNIAAVARAATVAVARAATVAVAFEVAVAVAFEVAVAVAVAFEVAVAVNPRVMEPRPRCRNRIKKRPLSERSEFRTLPDFGAGDVGTRSAAEGSIFGVAFSWLLLLAKQKK